MRLRGLPHDSRFARALRAAPDPVHAPRPVVSSLSAAEAAMRRWAGAA